VPPSGRSGFARAAVCAANREHAVSTPTVTDRAAEALSSRGAWLLLGTLAALVLAAVPELGAGGWNFRPGIVHPSGILAPLVRAADRRFAFGFIRTPGVLAGLTVALVAGFGVAWLRRRAWIASALTVLVLLCLLAPAVLLQVGLRRSTAPWFFTNDSTYQIEIAGDLVLDGENPYGHDYRQSGLERFYSLDGSVSEETRGRQVALRHFAYFPGTAEAAAAWRVLPGPLDDVRLLVALCTLALLPAALLFPGPLSVRLALGAMLAGNPLVVRGAWFGTADAPSLLLLVLAFALVLRSRWIAAGALLAGAVLFKQFALVALPFLAVLAWRRGGRPALARGGAAFVAVALAGTLPFLIADPGALWADTVTYGASTYRIIGYGLASLLLRAGVIDDRFDYYPFAWLALFVWVPATLALLRIQRQSPALWQGASCFAVSIFLLLFLGRVFQTSYLVWPLTAIAVAGLIAGGERMERDRKVSEPAGAA
jgi:hypothetical protein